MPIFNLGSLGNANLSTAAVTGIEQLVEESFEPLLHRLSQGGQTNSVLKEGLQNFFAPNSPAMQILRNAGVRHGGNVLAAVLAKRLERSADRLWPGRNDPGTQMLRFALKALAPVILGLAQAGMDFTQQLNQMDDQIDQTVSDPNVASMPVGSMDEMIYVTQGLLQGQVFPPLRDPTTQAVLLTDAGSPRSNDDMYTRALLAYEAGQKTTTTTKGSGRGASTTTTTTTMTPFAELLPLKVAAQRYLSARPDPATAARLEAALKAASAGDSAPKHKLQLVDPHTAEVLMALSDTRSGHDEGTLSWEIPWYALATVETLTDDVLQGPVPAEVLDRYMANITVEDDGTLSKKQFLRLYHRKDMLLGANQTIPQQGLGVVWELVQDLGRRFNLSLWKAVLLTVFLVGMVLTPSVTYIGFFVWLFVWACELYVDALTMPLDAKYALVDLGIDSLSSVTGLTRIVFNSLCAAILTFVVAKLIDLMANFWVKLTAPARALFKWPASGAEGKDPDYKHITRKLVVFGIILPAVNAAGAVAGMPALGRMVLSLLVFVAVAALISLADAGLTDVIKKLAESGAVNLAKVATYAIVGLITLSGIITLLGFLPAGTGTSVLTWFEDPWHFFGSMVVLYAVVAVALALLLKGQDDLVRTIVKLGGAAVVVLFLWTGWTATAYPWLAAWWNDDTPPPAQVVTTTAPVQPAPSTTTRRPARGKSSRSRNTASLGDDSITEQCARGWMTESFCTANSLFHPDAR